jgi:hypothetical protein
MATRKTHEALPTAAMSHGQNAYGARFVRPGFSFTPELDLRFALGYGSPPFAPMVLLSDRDPATLGKLKWPEAISYRNVAIHCLRHPSSLEARSPRMPAQRPSFPTRPASFF